MNLWKEMIEKGCKPNSVVYSALIDGLCRVGKPDEAEEFLFEMTNKGCFPNAFTYSSLMKGFFESGKSAKAIQIWKEMAKNNVICDAVCYTVLINGLCRDGKLSEVNMVWTQMLFRGCKPNDVPESQPDVVPYNILFNALCKKNNISGAIDLLNSMVDRGCDPDVYTCDIFLTALKELDTPEDRRELLDELVVRRFKRKRNLGAYKIVEVMLQKFLSPKASTWEKIVQDFCKPKILHAALDKCWRSLYS
ncbi:hypothetical protein Pint_11914 [Pistacia integerrima]|uniref:Uncharacterized protein n=1 Tax=Pistacia integerrima TaxID=434235 RepID=A0ACC0XJL5_9ROSI|nr:hypothetical protein Pint_11914 [Pistacia integerrima]